jgi:dTDP-4-amino-4,6-dideoxygalactose transaminase
MTIPFFPPDLFEADRETLLTTVREIGLHPGQKFILGERTARFEQALRAELGVAEVIACSSGTSALTLILHAMGVGPGDEVVVPAYGCAPLANTVVNLGAIPVFADIDPWTMVVDPEQVERAVTTSTKAIVPAHMFSVMADMPRLRELARLRGVRLVEDSAVAQGALLDGRPAGTWGDAGLFSFVQVKTFGRCATTARLLSGSSTTESVTTAASTKCWPLSSCTGCRGSPPGWNAGPGSPSTTRNGSRRCASTVWCRHRRAATAAVITCIRCSPMSGTR